GRAGLAVESAHPTALPYPRSTVPDQASAQPTSADALADLDARLGLAVSRDVRVPTRDGLTVSVNLFRPRGATAAVPAILNTDPYRKDDWSAAWDLTIASYLAARGYAYCRLDV